ncbi:MAG TPA: M48 family metallopeptidase [Polyangiaceae bacterium]|nr:M48 family metallopeptidase [Polyangiaceae bacterium]
MNNPVTGKPELSLVSKADEIALGKRAEAEVLETVGPYDDPKLEAYVARMGLGIAKITERPDLPWSFHVLDDPAVNAFALPGGPVFVTRGILAHLTSEAELAAVLGHECGHIAAKHSVAQMSRDQLAGLGIGLGSVLIPDMARFQGLVGAGVQLLFLQYSRSAEEEADDLGFRYALTNGWDARDMKDLFVMLSGVGRQDGARVPQWLSTHPNPENRLERIEERLSQLESIDWASKRQGRDSYLQAIDGVVFGHDDREGYMRANTFIHPGLGFRIAFPPGFAVQNQRNLVVAVSQERDAAAVLGVVSKKPEDALKEFLSNREIETIAPPAGDGAMSPLTRYFRARTADGTLGGVVSFLSFGGHTFEYVAYSTAERFGRYQTVFASTLASFAQEADPKLLHPKVARIAIAKVALDMSLREFNVRFPSVIGINELALINGVSVGEVLAPGRLVKRVVEEPIPGRDAKSEFEH